MDNPDIPWRSRILFPFEGSNEREQFAEALANFLMSQKDTDKMLLSSQILQASQLFIDGASIQDILAFFQTS